MGKTSDLTIQKTINDPYQKDKIQEPGDFQKEWNGGGGTASKAIVVRRQTTTVGFLGSKPLLSPDQWRKSLNWTKEIKNWTVAATGWTDSLC